MAAVLVSRTYDRQRRLSASKVDEYARDMVAGEWHRSPDAITISDTGYMINGQHRCAAVIRAGVTVPVTIGWGYPEDAFNVIDCGRPRQAYDVGPEWFGKVEQSVERAMQIPERRYGNKLSRVEELRFAEFHKHAIMLAASCGNRTASLSVLLAPVRGAIARASYTVARADLVNFVEVLDTGILEVRSQSGAVLLRDYVLRQKAQQNTGGMAVRQEMYLRAERAIESFVKREGLQVLKSRDKSIYPLPSPPGEAS
jgi:hypothetical protein